MAFSGPHPQSKVDHGTFTLHVSLFASVNIGKVYPRVILAAVKSIRYPRMHHFECKGDLDNE